MLSALAERGIRRPRRILIGALVTFVVAAVLGGPVAGQLDSANGFEDPGSSSVAARQAIQKASGLDASPGLIAVIDTPAGAAGAEAQRRVAAVAHVLHGVSMTAMSPGDASRPLAFWMAWRAATDDDPGSSNPLAESS